MRIEIGTPRYEELFGKLERHFQSSLPPHGLLLEALADPSLDPNLIDENFQISDTIGSVGMLRSQGVEDLTSGVQHMLRAIAVTKTGITEAASAGILTSDLPAVRQVTQLVDYASSMTALGVNAALGLPGTTVGGTPGTTAARAAFGVGMSALSAMGPVGMCAAAIIGFAAAIFNAFRSAKVRAAKEEAERLAAAYEALPPLQEPRARVDEWYVENVVMGVLETGSWTRLFAPRFDPSNDWFGAKRHGGFGFAPGKPTADTDAWGHEIRLFTPSDGVGFIPGMNEITSIIQVSLDWHQNPVLEHWRDSGGRFPITQAIVTDVGSFLVNTGRLCNIVWSWVSNGRGSPHLYKVYVGTAKWPASGSLHRQWRDYCEGGLRFLKENAADWFSVDPETHQLSKKRLRNPNTYEYLFGSAIACAIGTWACVTEGGTTNHPDYAPLIPGYPRFDIQKRSIGANWKLGCVMDPTSAIAKGNGKVCLITMYDSHIKPTLERLRERQVHELRHSLVSAYVRRSWDAFRDDQLHGKLIAARRDLLEHPDRKLIRLADVPENEPGVPGVPGGTWKEQLIASGVKQTLASPALQRLSAGGKGTIEPEAEPPAVVPGSLGVMPFAGTELIPPDPPRSNRWMWIAGTGLVAVGAGVLAYRKFTRGQHGRRN